MWLKLLTALLFASSAIHGAPEKITQASQFEELSAKEADQHLPVSLDAVIIYLRAPGLPKFVLQDESGGVTAEALDPALLLGRSIGERVLAVGHTAGSRRGNVFRVSSLKVLGTPGLPPARPVSVAELVEGEPTGGLYEIQGTVRSVRLESEVTPSRLILGIGPSRMRLNIWVANHEGHEATWPPDTVIRVRGVMQRWISDSGQPYSTFLLVNGPNEIEILSPAPDDPWSAPAMNLQKFRIPPSGDVMVRRRCVRGIVTWHSPGSQLAIQNQDRGLWIDISSSLEVAVGDAVEVLGFPSPGDYSGKMEDVLIRRTGRSELPQAIILGDIDITQRRPDGLDHDGLRVTIQGRLDSILRQRDGMNLEVVCAGRRIPCVLPGMASLPARIQPGSEIAITGVSRLGLSDHAKRLGYTADSMMLGVASISDVSILRPAPWWTMARMRGFLVMLGVALGISALWGLILREKNRRLLSAINARERAEHQLAGERHRVASDLHDTLEQTLFGVELQLTAASRSLNSRPAISSDFISRAHQLLKRSRSEVRETVWDLHRTGRTDAPCLEEALEQLKKEYSIPNGPQVSLRITGKRTPVPALITTHLIRAAKESITNAVKHSRGAHLEIELGYLPDQIQLSIADDGIGFDPQSVPGPDEGHFGMIGLRERIERLHGIFSIHSAPAQGTRIEMTVPLQPQHLSA